MQHDINNLRVLKVTNNLFITDIGIQYATANATPGIKAKFDVQPIFNELWMPFLLGML